MTDLAAQLQATLGDAYRLDRELGGGGMSRVFLAHETALGRRVVIKVLLPELAAGVSVERFRREIQLAAQLQHPHIVPLLSAGESEGLPFFTMPFIAGESLRVRLGREGELPINATLRILRDVVSAIGYAHGHGVMHRDIKPDNVLLSGGVAVVTDFGVAKALRESGTSSHAIGDAEASGTALTSMGIALGTPAYMAPEQATADPTTDHRADLYALGAMAYEMLAGRAPFAGRSPQATLAAHAIEAPEPVDRLRPGVPPLLGTLVMQCLAKRPADRPQTALEVQHTLDAIGTPTGGTTPTRVVAPAGRGTAATRAPAATHDGGDADGSDPAGPRAGRGQRGRAVTLAAAGGVLVLAAAVVLRQARTPNPESGPAEAPITSPAAAPEIASPPKPAAPAASAGDSSVADSSPAAPQARRPEHAAPEKHGAESARARPSTAPPARRAQARDSLAGAARASLPAGARDSLGMPARERRAQLSAPPTSARQPSALPLAPADSARRTAPSDSALARLPPRDSAVPAPVTPSLAPRVSAPPSSSAVFPQRASSAGVAPAPSPSVQGPPPPPAPAPAAAPRPGQVDARAAIRGLVADYAAAVRSRSVADLRRIYPAMTASQQQSWEQFFATVSHVDAQLGLAQLSIGAGTAEGQVTGSYTYTNESTHRREEQAISFRAAFRLAPGGWQISEVR